MPQRRKPFCPECKELDRRDFLGTLGKSAVVLGGLAPAASWAADAPVSSASLTEKPAESLIKELYTTLSDDQKKSLVYSWNHGADNGLPSRMKMVNAPLFSKKIGDSYTKPQQELCQKIFRAICSDEEGYQRLSRNGKFDGSGSFEGLGAVIFGEPTDNKQYALVFSGHHLTVRCDGNSEPGAAFGGPMYYGHSPNGYSSNNVFNFQTKSVLSVYDALNADQRKKAIVSGKGPGEQYESVRFRPKDETKPGIMFSELSSDQKELAQQAMRTILSPYRKEDADEVMEIVKTNGGMDQVHLAFYEDGEMKDNQKWHFWRIEGPGFVWNYRVLPHVHTFVNISSKV
jgi:hypothetical protein